MNGYVSPTFKGGQFTCPHCGVLTNHEWRSIIYPGSTQEHKIMHVSVCSNNACGRECLWQGGIMTIPDMEGISYPNSDLLQEIQEDYLEARTIASRSPRGAAALLRLALQKLMVQLGEAGEDINTDIANLVKKGLRPSIQQALDIVRVTGNESVHPGTLDIRDNPEIATRLFDLINLIADVMISEPRRVDEMYTKVVPEGKRAAIEKRDAN